MKLGRFGNHLEQESGADHLRRHVADPRSVIVVVPVGEPIQRFFGDLFSGAFHLSKRFVMTGSGKRFLINGRQHLIDGDENLFFQLGELGGIAGKSRGNQVMGNDTALTEKTEVQVAASLHALEDSTL